MFEPEPSDSSADKEQHSAMPEMPLTFSEIVEMIVCRGVLRRLKFWIVARLGQHHLHRESQPFLLKDW